MDMESAYRARLLAAAPVAALVGQRVTWVDRPQAAALPAVTLQLVTDERVQSYSGLDGAQPGYVQVDVWGLTYAAVKAAKEAVVNALLPATVVDGVRFTRATVSARDLSERTDTQLIFRQSIDFNFFYATA